MNRSAMKLMAVMALVGAAATASALQQSHKRVAESAIGSRISPQLRTASAVMEGRAKIGFVGWVQPDQLGWEPFRIPGLPDAEYKLLSIDPASGARSQITHISAGWKRPKGYQNSGREIFLLSGDLTIGDDRMTKYSYAYYPAGYAQPEAHSEHGAEFLDWWEGEPDFVASEQSAPGTRTDAVVSHWNFYERPWNSQADMGKWANTPPPDGILLKVMRKDKETGAMTWINAGASKAVSHDAYVNWAAKAGGNWEAHTTWEEGIILEGDLSFGECIPGEGAVVGTYTQGGYFFRPAGILHVGPVLKTNSYSWVIQRTPKQLWADYYPACGEKASAASVSK